MDVIIFLIMMAFYLFLTVLSFSRIWFAVISMLYGCVILVALMNDGLTMVNGYYAGIEQIQTFETTQIVWVPIIMIILNFYVIMLHRKDRR